MCVLVPFGVNNPASLLVFCGDESYNSESEYIKRQGWLYEWYSIGPISKRVHEGSGMKRHVRLLASYGTAAKIL